MKKELMEILVCPVCKGKLELKAVEEEKGEIIVGVLCCRHCNVDYPIKGAIPILLPPESGR